MHELYRRQRLHSPLDTIWEFIREPANLDTITPPDLQFRIVSDVPEEMYNGLIVDYRLLIPVIGQILGPQRWVTEIKHIRPQLSFVDEQRLGPYRFWYHYHEVTADGDCTVMVDRVNYEIGYWFMGKIVNAIFVQRTLERIFNYRRQRLAELFGSDAG